MNNQMPMPVNNVCNALKTTQIAGTEVMCMLLSAKYPTGNITRGALRQFLVERSIHGQCIFEAVMSIFKQYDLCEVN